MHKIWLLEEDPSGCTVGHELEQGEASGREMVRR